MTSGAVEKVASKIGVQDSNPGRDCQVCELFRMAKTDDSYVKIPTKTDQNDEKNVRALIGFGEVKATKTDDFLCLNRKNFSTRVIRPTMRQVITIKGSFSSCATMASNVNVKTFCPRHSTKRALVSTSEQLLIVKKNIFCVCILYRTSMAHAL